MNPKIAIIGAGNVGLGLAHAFSSHGFDVKLGSRNTKSIKGDIDKGVIVCAPIDAIQNADLNILCVPDSAIVAVCESLAGHFKKGCVVTHCSGAIASDALTTAKAAGCRVASAHPLNTFPNPQAAIQLFEKTSHNTALYCEGDDSALKVIKFTYADIGFLPVEISAHAKPLYHAACVFACNYLTVLMDISLQTAEAADLDRDVFWKSIQPLVQSTLTNIGTHGTANSLSGPVARADIATIEKHIHELEPISNALRDTYINLAKHAALLAKQKDHINSEKLDELDELIKKISD